MPDLVQHPVCTGVIAGEKSNESGRKIVAVQYQHKATHVSDWSAVRVG